MWLPSCSRQLKSPTRALTPSPGSVPVRVRPDQEQGMTKSPYPNGRRSSLLHLQAAHGDERCLGFRTTDANFTNRSRSSSRRDPKPRTSSRSISAITAITACRGASRIQYQLGTGTKRLGRRRRACPRQSLHPQQKCSPESLTTTNGLCLRTTTLS